MTDETTNENMSEHESAESGTEIEQTPDAGVKVQASDPDVKILENSGPTDLHYLVVRSEKGATQLAKFAAAAMKGDNLSVNHIDIDQLELDDLAPAFEDGGNDE